MLLHPQSLPTTVAGARLVRYAGPAAIRAIGSELSHLDRLASVADGRGHSAWLEETVGHEDLAAVTISRDGQLVGYAVGSRADGLVVLGRIVVVPAVRAHHPELVDVLVHAALDSAGLPWADVAVPADALAPLVDAGWTVAGHRDGLVVLHGADAR